MSDLGGDGMSKRSKKGLWVVSLFLILLVGMTGCANKGNQGKASGNEKKKIMMYVDVKDKHSLNIINFIVDEYKKENKEVEIDVNTPLDNSKIADDISKGGKADIVFTSRNTMLELNKKGLLSEQSDFYEKNQMNDKFYKIMSSYGRIGDKYYGVGIIPYSLEVFYSNQGLSKINGSPPKNIVEVVPVLKKANETNTKVPVILTEDLDIYNAFASILFSNLVDLQKVENAYDSGEKAYRELKEVQAVFDNINLLVKQGSINRDTAEVATENSLSRLATGDVPIAMAISYYSKDMKEEKIGIVEDYSMSPLKENIPIVMNGLLCIPANTKNEEAVNEFLEFIVDEKIQKKLSDQGFVTANKKINMNQVGIKKIISDHLEEAGNNSIVYIYNFPKKFQPAFESKIIKVLNGKHTGNEWNEIIDEVNK
jgi:raffinose/stachyose/melibiose transport system substrate-binding protein